MPLTTALNTFPESIIKLIRKGKRFIGTCRVSSCIICDPTYAAFSVTYLHGLCINLRNIQVVCVYMIQYRLSTNKPVLRSDVVGLKSQPSLTALAGKMKEILTVTYNLQKEGITLYLQVIIKNRNCSLDQDPAALASEPRISAASKV